MYFLKYKRHGSHAKQFYHIFIFIKQIRCAVPLRCAREVHVSDMNIRMNGEVLEEVQMFKYLGSNVTARGDVVDEVVY